MAKNAKAVRVFHGHNTFGISVEVALADTGKWYQRTYVFNGYSKSWSKWSTFDEPTFSTHGRNVYTQETYEREEPLLEYGFSLLTEYHNDIPKYRLPL